MRALAWLGSALLLLLLVDSFSTVFFPQGRGGLVNRRQNRLLWALFRRTGRRRDGTPRDGWLALAGPSMVVATIAAWMAWLVLAWALIYLPWIESFLVSPGSLRAPWWEALYFSGYTAATLGFGDLVPDHMALRVLAPVEAFSGFALISAAITYFLAVYRELIRKEALAAGISSYFQRGEQHVLDFACSGGADAVARWSEATSTRMAEVLLAHHQYPVLHYFRSSSSSRALPAQLECLIGLRRLARERDRSGACPALTGHPGYLALCRTTEEYVREMAELFISGSRKEARSGSGDEVERSYEALARYMLAD